MTGTFQQESETLWVNSTTKYSIEYREDVGDYYVVIDADNCIVWEFPTLETSVTAAEEHYQSDLEWETYFNEGNV
jgi:hypothetical protein